MICPKCGLEQEERLECRKCGIVFNKYFALYPSSQYIIPKSNEELLAQEFPDMESKMRELNARFVEIEFEKAERNRLRTDLIKLEQQLRKDQEQTAIRLEQIEKSLTSLPKNPELKVNEQIQQILPKCAACENKTARIMDNLSLTINQLGDLWEKIGRNSDLTSELHDRVAALQKEVLEIKDQLNVLRQTQNNEEPRTIHDDDVRSIRKNLDELGQFISSLSREQ